MKPRLAFNTNYGESLLAEVLTVRISPSSPLSAAALILPATFIRKPLRNFLLLVRVPFGTSSSSEVLSSQNFHIVARVVDITRTETSLILKK